MQTIQERLAARAAESLAKAAQTAADPKTGQITMGDSAPAAAPPADNVAMLGLPQIKEGEGPVFYSARLSQILLPSGEWLKASSGNLYYVKGNQVAIERLSYFTEQGYAIQLPETKGE